MRRCESDSSLRMSRYEGLCAQCGVGRNDKNFASRPQGRELKESEWLLEDARGQRLPFFFKDESNNRVCDACYLRNWKCKQRPRAKVMATPAPPRKRLVDVVTPVTPVHHSSVSSVASVTPLSVSIVKKPRSTKQRCLPVLEQSHSHSDFDLPPSTPRMPGRSEAAHQLAQTFAADLPGVISFSALSWVSVIMASPCSRMIRGSICGGHLNPFAKSVSRNKVSLSFVCALCGASSTFVGHVSTGAAVELECLGANDEKVKVRFDDLRTVLKVLLSGATQQQYSIMNSGDASRVPKSTFYTTQRLICPAVVRVLEESLLQVRVQMAEDFQNGVRAEWHAVVNGAWSHRGWVARHHTFQVRDHDTGLVVCSVVLVKSHYVYSKSGVGEDVVATAVFEGNYVGSSRAMENEALEIALGQLREAGLLPFLRTVAADGDLGIDIVLRQGEDTKHIRVAGDPGHAKKNFFKAMKTVCGETGKYMAFPYRISNFWMRCIKRAEKEVKGHTPEAVARRKEVFEELWKDALPHYCRKQCPVSCPCNEFYQLDVPESQLLESTAAALELMEAASNAEGDELDVIVPEVIRGEEGGTAVSSNAKVRFAEKLILSTGNAKEKQLISQLEVLMQTASENASFVLWALNTCAAEGANNRRLVFCRKDRFFYASYTARSCLSTLVDNYGLEETYKRLTAALKFPSNVADDAVARDLAVLDEGRKWHAKRKKSVAFNEAQKNAKMWKASHNVEVREAAADKNKRKKAKASTYKTSKSDGPQLFDAFRRTRGQRSQKDLRELHGKGLASQCQFCGKFYALKGKHNSCSGVWKEHGLPKEKKAASRKGRSRKRVEQRVSDDSFEEEKEGAADAEESRPTPAKKGRKKKELSPDIEDLEENKADEQFEWDVEELMLRSLVIPSNEDVEAMQVDEDELKNVTSSKVVEAAQVSMFVSLLQHQVCVPKEEMNCFPVFFFGPVLFNSFREREAQAVKDLFKDFFPAKVLCIVMNARSDHFVVLEASWFESQIVLYDSLLSDKALEGSVSAEDYFRSKFNMSVAQRFFTALDMDFSSRKWLFAQEMPQQNNGVDCGIFAMEILRIHARASVCEDLQEKARMLAEYKQIVPTKTRKYRARIAEELQTKKIDIHAKLK